ncbi:hypothetical protein THIOKS11610010 [Thiocapsa sp. KS1]|nr:hypothetical protein THIOKS11610010 [Thiocapsa sp. KS1]
MPPVEPRPIAESGVPCYARSQYTYQIPDAPAMAAGAPLFIYSLGFQRHHIEHTIKLDSGASGLGEV